MSIKRPAARVTWLDHDGKMHMDVVTFGAQQDGTIVIDLDDAVEYVRNREPGNHFGFEAQPYTTFEHPIPESWHRRLLRELQDA